MPFGTSTGASSVHGVLDAAVQQLELHRTARLDAELIVAHVLKKSRVWVLTHDEQVLDSEQIRVIESLIERRSAGEPLAYIRGYVEWFGSIYEVSRDVLIPRPETELLLSSAIELARETGIKRVVDVGTGSGALGTQLAVNIPDAQVTALDSSPAALNVARRNAEALGVAEQITFLCGDLLAPLTSRPELIVANLPYLSDTMMQNLPVDVRFEPPVALRGGPDGTELYSRLFDQMRCIAPHAALMLEIAPEQADAIVALLHRRLPDHHLEIHQDYSHDDRYVVARYVSARAQ